MSTGDTQGFDPRLALVGRVSEGRELDAKVARLVFGATVAWFGIDGTRDPLWLERDDGRVPRYTLDLSDTAVVVKEMIEVHGRNLEVSSRISDDLSAAWRARFDGGPEVMAESLPLAIVHAALAALDGTTGGGRSE